MKGQGERREGTSRSKIVNWGGNLGKKSTFHVFGVGWGGWVFTAGLGHLRFLPCTGEKEPLCLSSS